VEAAQIALASIANSSTRHLSYLETGRAQPSREMVMRLAEDLDIPLREF
jgi:transcriptional regulator with XRE-family HTH domain